MIHMYTETSINWQ